MLEWKSVRLHDEVKSYQNYDCNYHRECGLRYIQRSINE